ncbi:MAG: hypothetical protein ACI8ZM_004355 [Crocinitomix sp.]|jgi:hypothetical protein
MKPIFFTLLMLLLTFSCQKEKTIKPINSDIIITLSEDLDSTDRIFQLFCQTEGYFTNSGNSILYNYSKNGNEIAVEFTGFSYPETVFNGTGPATACIDFENIAYGTYPFDISLNNHTNSGILTVNEDAYSLIFEEPQQIQIPRHKLNRVPVNTIWGQINYHSADNEALANNFIDTLLSIGAVEQLYNPGDYSPFRIDSEGLMRQEEAPGYFFIYYIYQYTGNSSDLENLLIYYGITYSDLIDISLSTAKGEYFSS